MSEEDLVKFTKETAKEMGARGGRASAGKFKLLKTRKCSSRCPHYTRCIFAAYSKAKHEGRCALANMDMHDRRRHRFIKYLTGDRVSMEKLITGYAAEIEADITQKGTIQDKIRFMNSMKGVFQAIHGNKISMDVQQEVKGELTIDYLKQIFVKVKGEIKGEDNGNKDKDSRVAPEVTT